MLADLRLAGHILRDRSATNQAFREYDLPRGFFGFHAGIREVMLTWGGPASDPTNVAMRVEHTLRYVRATFGQHVRR